MKENRHIGRMLLLLALIGANMYLGDVNIGPTSPRLYLYAAALAWMFAQWMVGRERPLADARAQVLLVCYGVYILWSAVALTLQNAPLRTIISVIVSYHGIAVATFLITLFVLRTRADVGRFLAGLVLLFLVSTVIALLQWHFVPWSWSIWHRMRPHAEVLAGYPGLVQNEWGFKRIAIAGLFGSAVTFGYYIAVLTPVVFRRFLARRSITSLLALCLTIAAAIVVQQRAALLAAIISCAVLLFAKLGERGARLKTLVVVALFAGIIGGIVYVGSASNEMRTKYDQLLDTGRLDVAMIALRHVARNPGLGGAREYELAYERERTAASRYIDVIAPHNLFLNAAVFYGTPGLLLTVFLLVVLAAIMARAWTAARARLDWTTMTLVMSIIGYVLVAQFHNASFVTGDALPWVFIAALLTASRETVVRPVEAPLQKGLPKRGLRIAGEWS